MVDGPKGLEVAIPPRRQFFAIVFLPVWLCGWLFGEVEVIRQLTSHETRSQPDLFLIAWLAGWTVGGGLALLTLLWLLVGRERVTLRPDALLIKHEIAGLGRTKEYDIGSIQNLRVSPVSYNPWDGSRSAQKFWGIGGGVIAFDYGATTCRFGAGIDEAEARDIVAQMRARHSFSISPDAA